MKPLFICHGNLMRSQMAEAFYNHMTGTTDAMSAGVSVFTPHQFTTPNIQAVMVMEEEGLDISSQTIKLVTPEMIAQADEVYVMTTHDDVPDFVRDDPKTIFWYVADPYGQPTPIIRAARDKIKALVAGIIPSH